MERSVQSIQNQTYKNLEIILVDDGSKDDSLKVCNEYVERDQRIKVVHQENRGVSAARNQGKKLNDLSPEEKHCWLKYHGRGLGSAASVPYFYKDYCFIFRKIHKVPHLITVYKNPVKDAPETPSQEKI